MDTAMPADNRDRSYMPDVAAGGDQRGITLDRVGIRDLHLPVRILQKAGGEARVVGVFDATVELPHHERGTHMSRFVEVLGPWSKKRISQIEMREILAELVAVFDAPAAYLSMGFKYFLDKITPVSRLACQLDYDCWFDAKMVGEEFCFAVEVQVPVMTVCPCSLEISEGGAHSQRAVVSAAVGTEVGVVVWLEDLIPLLERQGSYEVFPVLKREDEKHVTEKAFANPKFVEDVVRDSILALQALPGVKWYEVTCISQESIHNHNAYAYASGGEGIWSLR
ncbi:MAG: GTP cyclohydrolase FolE2 [Armatimonadetes bacterium]|nr:GTP cyclohydrolase FolE2 [Armatimonadota bacterium]